MNDGNPKNMKNSGNNSLSMAIVFASLVLSGSLVFFGLQLNGDQMQGDVMNLSSEELQDEINKGIEAYVQNAQKGNSAGSGSGNSKTVTGDYSDDDAFIGDEDAPITIVEFSDYECPFCGRFYSQTLPQIKEKYIDTGKVKLVYRDFPLQNHPGARVAASLAECARAQKGDDMYFKIHDQIFDDLVVGKRFDEESMVAFAVAEGANEAELNECMTNDDFKAEIDKDIRDGVEAGISGTPGFIVGDTLVSGAQPFAAFEAAIEAQL